MNELVKELQKLANTVHLIEVRQIDRFFLTFLKISLELKTLRTSSSCECIS